MTTRLFEAISIAERFGVSTEVALRVAAFIQNVNRNPATRVLGVAIDKANQPYYYIAQLGEGTYGEVYSASRDASRPATHVVKEFSTEEEGALTPRTEPLLAVGSATNIVPHDDYEFEDEYVEREFLIARVIRRRLGEQYCRAYAVCALDRFYSRDEKRGYIVFPFISTLTLVRYLTLFIHNRMRRYRASTSTSGFAGQAVETLRVIAAGTGNLAEDARRALNEMYEIQMLCANIAQQCMTAVALLHRALIFHQDLKPDNMIVNNAQVMLIDFGIACVATMRGDELYDENERQYLYCEDTYRTTLDYQDPLAPLLKGSTEIERIELFAKFDTYAMGKLLQTIFDPSILNDAASRIRYPTVRRTEFMLPGIYELIQRMTGEKLYEPFNFENIRLTEAEYEARMTAFDKRPSMPQVAVAVAQAVMQWTASR